METVGMKVQGALVWGIAAVGLLLTLGTACSEIKVLSKPTAPDNNACTTDNDCSSNDSCRTGTCDKSTKSCVYSISADSCYINGACYAEGSSATDKCNICVPLRPLHSPQ